MHEEKVQVKEGYLKLADEMSKAIVDLEPVAQNEVIRSIINNVKDHRGAQIDHKSKEVEILKSLNTEI